MKRPKRKFCGVCNKTHTDWYFPPNPEHKRGTQCRICRRRRDKVLRERDGGNTYREKMRLYMREYKKRKKEERNV